MPSSRCKAFLYSPHSISSRVTQMLSSFTRLKDNLCPCQPCSVGGAVSVYSDVTNTPRSQGGSETTIRSKTKYSLHSLLDIQQPITWQNDVDPLTSMTGRRRKYVRTSPWTCLLRNGIRVPIVICSGTSPEGCAPGLWYAARESMDDDTGLTLFAGGAGKSLAGQTGQRQAQHYLISESRLALV
jgi:hypothetical protein